MKKVGILTYHRADNYGAVLQVYALQNTIIKLGHKCEIIDYRCKGIEDQYRYRKFKNLKSAFGTIKFNTRLYLHRKKHKNFEEFRKKLIMSSSYTKDNIINTNDKYDFFITGSDQVWNYNVNNKDFTYLLDFVKDSKKKNSYAASFGISIIPNDLKELYKKLLSSFEYISVRENKGNNIVKDLLGYECEVVLDPIFLLEKKDWMEFYNQNSQNYVLIYQLYKSKNLIKFAKELANKKGCKIIIISQSLYGAYYGLPGSKNKSNVGPDEFISLFLGAKYIVTNSFHGTALSINFQKEFFTEYISGEDVNTRFDTLLNILRLEERRIQIGKPVDIDKVINYKRVDELLNQYRMKALNYLKRIVGSDNE